VACGDERPASRRLHALTDPYSAEEYRINGVVSDMAEFAKALACKSGQPMVGANGPGAPCAPIKSAATGP
jgi:endothelin-converting enzyme/putative endopeptidase